LKMPRCIGQEVPICRLRSFAFVEATRLLWSCNLVGMLWQSKKLGDGYLYLRGKMDHLTCL
jgi:hypothetical protein